VARVRRCRAQEGSARNIVPVSSEGTIVTVHSVEDQAYEVEFFDKNNKTIDICTVVGDEYLELKWAYKDTK
jgi:hypothetical protein